MQLSSESLNSTNCLTLDILIDWEELRDFSDNDEAFMWELLKMYLQDTQRHLSHAKSMKIAHNFTKVADEAHYLKGCSANVGMHPMTALAAELEIKAHQHLDSEVNDLLNQIEIMLAQLEKLLKNPT